MDSELFLRLTEAERRALIEHQRRITERDKDKRRRAIRSYRVFLDYLESNGHINKAQRDKLEYWRMDKRHVQGQ